MLPNQDNRKTPVTSATVTGPELTGRVFTLESEMQRLTSVVEKQGEQIQSGFNRTQVMFQDMEKRAEERDSKLHDRITEQQAMLLKKGQVSWPLVVSILFACISVGGVIVSFVLMSLTPVSQQLSLLTQDLRTHQAAEGHPTALADHAKLATEMVHHTESLLFLQTELRGLSAWQLKTERELGRLETFIGRDLSEPVR